MSPQQLTLGIIAGMLTTFMGIEISRRIHRKQNTELLALIVKLLKNTEDSIIERIKAPGTIVKSVSERLLKAHKITQDQLDMLAAIKQPSKNSLHSQYKNQTISEIRKLEDQKLDILQSILDDGQDPDIAVKTVSGKIEQVPLSRYMVQQADKKIKMQKPLDPKHRSNNKFTVHEGGKE